MLYEFRGYDGQIELYENKIVIRRTGVARLTRGFSLGDKEIYLKSITGIQVKKPGLRSGYIQFIFSGSKENKESGIMKAATDENTVMFNGGKQKYQEALALKQQIETLIHQPVSYYSYSGADELLKFKNLLDAGVITEDEFQTEKSRLLEKHRIPKEGMAEREENLASFESKDKMAKSKKMNAPALVCFLSAILFLLIGIAKPFCLLFAIIFVFLGMIYKKYLFSLSAEPYYIHQKTGKKTKKSFVISLTLLLVFMFLIVGITLPGENDNVSNGGGNETTQTETQGLAQVQVWYEEQIPFVSQSLLEYAQSVQGISNMNITESQFRFGEDGGWYDCHYTFYFTCQIDGNACTGEARAFMKYQENVPNWYHFEIFRDSDWSTLVEHYDESYEQVIEDYYKELEAQYS